MLFSICLHRSSPVIRSCTRIDRKTDEPPLIQGVLFKVRAMAQIKESSFFMCLLYALTPTWQNYFIFNNITVSTGRTFKSIASATQLLQTELNYATECRLKLVRPAAYLCNVHCLVQHMSATGPWTSPQPWTCFLNPEHTSPAVQATERASKPLGS